jgi:sodium/hydrogen exchanger 10/11
LSHIIDGEALLNDGSAFVLFLIFKDAVIGASTGSEVLFFFRLALGGPAFGYAVSMVLNQALRHMNDAIYEVSTIITLMYFAFYGAELCGLSGVLATVTLGVYMSRGGKLALSPEGHETMHQFLSVLAYMCNTVMFVGAGLVVHHQGLLHIEAVEWGTLILNYIAIHVFRAAAIAMCYPFLAKMGYGINLK